MKPEQYYDFLKSNGFEIINMGGGCTAWVKELSKDRVLMTSQELSHEINPDWLYEDWGGIHVGIFEGEEWLDTDDNSTHATINSAMERITQLLGVNHV